MRRFGRRLLASGGAAAAFDLTELRGWWDFNSNGNDSHTTSRDLTPINSPTFSGGAVDLEANNLQYLSSSDSGFNITGELTLVAFIRPESFGNNRGVISRYVGSGNQRQFVLFFTSVGAVGVALSASGANESSNNTITSAGAVTTGADYFIAATYLPSTATKVYVDGSLAAQNTTSVPSSLYSSSSDLWVGHQFNALDSTLAMDGLIYWAAIFGRVLSDSEISTLYSIGASGTYADL